MHNTVSSSISENIRIFREYFPKNLTADIVFDEFSIGGKKACFCFVNGSSNTEVMVKIQMTLLSLTKDEVSHDKDMQDFMARHIPLNDKKLERDFTKLSTALLWAMSILFIDGFDSAVILDTKRYPSRSIEEPEKNKTMRGPRDGFCENVFFNTALIRRRIKSTSLAFESFDIGYETKTRVILAYMSDKCDKTLLEKIRKKLGNMNIASLTLSQQTLTDNLFNTSITKILNPFPKVRYVERPDTAASMLVEGKIGILCDTTPSAIFLPVNLYDMIEETDDYYFPPLTASYLRILRVAMLFVSVFLSPLWLLALEYPEALPRSLEFLLVDSKAFIPVWLQLIIVEVMMDALKIASLNTPNTISNSLSVVSGLLLSDFAITAGWLVPQTILYSAISSIANFIPTNYELSYAFKFWRMALIAFSAIFGLKGFFMGVALFIIILILNKTEDNRSYLYPFVPKDKRGILKLFIRTEKGKEQ